MALVGNCTHYTQEDSGTTEEHEVTYPDGSVGTINQPIYNQIENSYEDIYLIIKQVEFFQTYTNQSENPEETDIVKAQAVLFQIAGYESKEVRDADQEDWLFWENCQLNYYDYDSNLLTQCYDYIKSKKGFEELVND